MLTYKKEENHIWEETKKTDWMPWTGEKDEKEAPWHPAASFKPSKSGIMAPPQPFCDHTALCSIFASNDTSMARNIQKPRKEPFFLEAIGTSMAFANKLLNVHGIFFSHNGIHALFTRFGHIGDKIHFFFIKSIFY